MTIGGYDMKYAPLTEEEKEQGVVKDVTWNSLINLKYWSLPLTGVSVGGMKISPSVN
jgi:hypothetical protein